MFIGALMGRKGARYMNSTEIANCGFIITYSDGKMAKFNLLSLLFDVGAVSPLSDTFREAQAMTAAICRKLIPFIQQQDMSDPEESGGKDEDMAAQLEKMAQLVKEGFVTREEFEVFKKKLLGL